MQKTITLKAINGNYTILLEWLNKTIEPWSLGSELVNKISICLEEIFVNITSYAYIENVGNVKVSIEKLDSEIILTFEDQGIKYNPLQKEDPDITLSLNERQVGGLGIFMVKQMTKNIEYEYFNNKNRLELTFDTN